MFDPSTLLLLAALAAPPDSLAHAPTANDSVLASVVGPLIRPGDRLRVRTRSGATDGRAGVVSPLGLELRHDPTDIWSQPRHEALAWSQMDRIDLHTPHARNAAVVGATVGCVLGLALMATAAAYASSSSDYGPGGGTVLLAFVGGGVAGGCVGGLTGALVGSLFPAWKTVYQRR